MRRELHNLNSVTVRHHPDSRVAALLLVGWLASRLGWSLANSQIAGEGSDGRLCATAQTDGGEVRLTLKPAPELDVPGLGGLWLTSVPGLRVPLRPDPG